MYLESCNEDSGDELKVAETRTPNVKTYLMKL